MSTVAVSLAVLIAVSAY